MTDPVFSRRDAVTFIPEGSPRSYIIAPLTFRERQAFRADLAREGGVFPPRVQLIAALRSAIQEIAPGNATANAFMIQWPPACERAPPAIVLATQ